MQKPLLVAGYGSNILTDEGIIHKLFSKLQQECRTADFMIFPILDLEQLELFSNYKKLILVDTRLALPGLVEVLPLQDYRPTLHLSNIHDISLPDLFNLGALLGFELSKDVQIVTIGINDHTTLNDSISPELASFIKPIQQLLKSLICQETEHERVRENYNTFPQKH